MGSFNSLVSRFPERELEIRRRARRDPDFESICAEYEEAALALRHWNRIAETEGSETTAENMTQKMVNEYTDIVLELEVEVLAKLGRAI